MKKSIPFFVLCFWVLGGYSQGDSLRMVKELKAYQQVDRTKNLYANQKYSFSMSLSPYAHIAHGNNVNVMGVFDINFSDRLTWLDFEGNASVEANLGVGFEPYQGTRLNMGADIELLTQARRVNLYSGFQYSLGLPQATTLDNTSYINVGWHNYFMPLIGILYWPGKQDVTTRDPVKLRKYHHPGFTQLFYAKIQIGYSFLLGPVRVDSTGAFDSHLYQIVRSNTTNTLNIKLCVGINIPTFGPKKREYERFINPPFPGL